MKKSVKILSASILTVLLFGAAMFLKIGGKPLLDMSLTANAAIVKAEKGAVFHVGDMLDCGDHDDDEGICFNDYLAIDEVYLQGVVELGSSSVYYDEDMGWYKYIRLGNKSVRLRYNPPEEFIDRPIEEWEGIAWGFQLVGSGTEADSFTVVVIEQDPDELHLPELSCVNVSIGDSLSLNYYADKSTVDESETSSIKFEGPNGECTIPSESFNTVTIDGKDYYKFSYPVYTTQVEESVSISFLDSEENLLAYRKPVYLMPNSGAYKSSVASYCRYLWWGSAVGLIDGINDEIAIDSYSKNAARSILNLGTRACGYFGLNGGSGYAVVSGGTSWSAEKNKYAPDFDSADAKLSLVFDSKMSARIYIDGLEEGDTAVDTTTGKTLTAITSEFGACFEISHLTPKELAVVHCLNYHGRDYNFSALSYCYRTKNTDLAYAIWDYHQYASAYADAHPAMF